jgi:hypothetical protein
MTLIARTDLVREMAAEARRQEDRLTSGHPVILYTGHEAIQARLSVPEQTRLSAWLGNVDSPILGCVLTGGVLVEASFNRAFIEAIKDEVPPAGDRSMVVPRAQIKVRVLFGSGLSVVGSLHVIEGARWTDGLNFEAGSFRALTDAIVTPAGEEPRQGGDTLVNMYLATRIERA